jgi:uncharacterized cupin superfamily protein
MTVSPTELHVAGLATIDVGQFKPKPTTLTPGQEEASKVLWTSADETVRMGVWECTPGTFTATRVGYSEVAHIISGRCILINDAGERSEHGPGDLVVTNEGWTGKWIVEETVRKLFVIHRPAAS